MFPYSQMLPPPTLTWSQFPFVHVDFSPVHISVKLSFVFHHVNALDVTSEYYLCTLFLHFEFKHVSFLRQCYSALLWLSQPEKKLTFNHADHKHLPRCALWLLVGSTWKDLCSIKMQHYEMKFAGSILSVHALSDFCLWLVFDPHSLFVWGKVAVMIKRKTLIVSGKQGMNRPLLYQDHTLCQHIHPPESLHFKRRAAPYQTYAAKTHFDAAGWIREKLHTIKTLNISIGSWTFSTPVVGCVTTTSMKSKINLGVGSKKNLSLLQGTHSRLQREIWVCIHSYFWCWRQWLSWKKQSPFTHTKLSWYEGFRTQRNNSE